LSPPHKARVVPGLCSDLRRIAALVEDAFAAGLAGVAEPDPVRRWFGAATDASVSSHQKPSAGLCDPQSADLARVTARRHAFGLGLRNAGLKKCRDEFGRKTACKQHCRGTTTSGVGDQREGATELSSVRKHSTSATPGTKTISVIRERLAHVPEKWTPVFRQEHAPMQRK
jgi:hypothetical protein